MGVSGVSLFGISAAEPVTAPGIDKLAAHTGVGYTKLGAKPKANCNSQAVVVKLQTNGWHRDGIDVFAKMF